MAKINGKPSVFISLASPHQTQVTPAPVSQARMKSAVEIATEMAEDFGWENDPETIASLNAWHDELDAAWRADPEAQRRYAEWLETQAEVADLASLGEAGQHAIAGHDARWQEGGK